MAKANITQQLHDTLELNPGIKEVHFTGDGHYHFRAFKFGEAGKKYTRLASVPEKKNGVFTGKTVEAVIVDHNNRPDPAHVVVETLTRAQVLNTTPTADKGSAVIGADLANAVASMSTEELQAILKDRSKKK